MITEHNNKTQRNFSLSINKYADLTNIEFREIYAKRRASNGASTPVHLKVEGMLEKVDWREQGAVNPVMDQGQCGSCWAFSAIGAIEGAHFVKTKELLKLSEQQMVDCARDDYGNFGCGGGDEKAGLRYAMKNPIDTEETYPYTATDQKCKETTQSGLVIVTSVNLVSQNNPD
jgi:C1A family cysteine protease